MKPTYALRFLLVVVMLPLCFSIPSPASAQGEPWEIVVNDLRDLPDYGHNDVCDAVYGDSETQCTLRAAIYEANKHTNGDDEGVLIIIPAGTYTLTIPGPDENDGATGDLDIHPDYMNITIEGASAATTIINAAGLDRVFDAHYSTNSVEIRDLTITGGSLLGPETTSCQYCGAGVFNSGDLTLSNVIIRNNRADQTDFSNGTGHDGGGIFNMSPGNLLISSSIIRDNSAVRGGGIFSNSALTIMNSTISGNQAFSSQTHYTSAGAIENYGPASFSNSTISGNSALYVAGGINNHNTINLANVTLALNDSAYAPANLGNDSSATVNLRNSIIAYSGGESGAANCSASGTWNSTGYNVSDDNSCHLTTTGDLNNVDPRLGPLVGNGGFTPTHGLLFGSPAKDHRPGFCLLFNGGTVTGDQRGFNRSDGYCDTGAFEGLTWPVFLPSIRR